MSTFSERYGHKPVRSALQVDGMDAELRNGLWNGLDMGYFSTAKPNPMSGRLRLQDNPDHETLCKGLWLDYFKWLVATLPDEWEKVRSKLHVYFFEAKWFEVYDFIEFVVSRYPNKETNDAVTRYCNFILERESSAYRLVGREITQITDPTEIEAIESALKVKPHPVRSHLHSALNMLSDREERDYRNSVKESISAVEAAAQGVTGDPKATLDDALRIMKKDHDLHPALNEAFRKLYGWTGDAGGIRHALMDGGRKVTFDEAKFMLVACSAFVNLVLASTPATVKK